MFKLSASIFELFVKENKMRADKNSFERMKVRINRQSSYSTAPGKLINCMSSVDDHMIRVIIVLQSPATQALN